jgi:hypothetical protein
MPEETKAVCPDCGSELVVEISNMKKCNQCGAQWGLDRNPIVAQAAARKAERSPSTGFTPHHHATEGLADLEQQLNEAERILREASMFVLCGKGPELVHLREAERIARDWRDRLLARRAELVARP